MHRSVSRAYPFNSCPGCRLRSGKEQKQTVTELGIPLVILSKSVKPDRIDRGHHEL